MHPSNQRILGYLGLLILLLTLSLAYIWGPMVEAYQ